VDGARLGEEEKKKRENVAQTRVCPVLEMAMTQWQHESCEALWVPF
jgi:hypothetical protein